jgi:hypothetical protein
MEWDWRFLFGVSGIILCNVNAREFGVWTLQLYCTTYACASGLTICNFCLLLKMVGVTSWNLGWVVGGRKHVDIANGQSLSRLP